MRGGALIIRKASDTAPGAVARGALQIEGMQLANAKGSHWADPDMRPWQGDSGTLHRFGWSS